MWTWSAWGWPSRILGLAWSAISVAGSYVTARVSSLGMLVSQDWFLFDVAMVCAVLLGCLQQCYFWFVMVGITDGICTLWVVGIMSLILIIPFFWFWM